MSKPTRVQKETTMVIFLSFLVLAIILLFLKGFILPKFLKPSVSTTSLPTAPPEIYQPLPSIQKIKDIIDDPRLDEMQYYRPFPPSGAPSPDTSTQPQPSEGILSPGFLPKFGTFEIGRPNPFIPFAPEK